MTKFTLYQNKTYKNNRVFMGFSCFFNAAY